MDWGLGLSANFSQMASVRGLRDLKSSYSKSGASEA